MHVHGMNLCVHELPSEHVHELPLCMEVHSMQVMEVCGKPFMVLLELHFLPAYLKTFAVKVRRSTGALRLNRHEVVLFHQ